MRRLPIGRLPRRVRFLGLLLAGSVSLLVGLVLLLSNLYHSPETRDLRIPAGADQYGWGSFEARAGSWLRGRFEVSPTESAVDLYVLDESGFVQYRQTLTSPVRYLDLDGNGGALGARLPKAGRYYVVADHSLVNANVDQRVHLEFWIEDPDQTALAASVGLTGVGLVLVPVAWRTGGRRRRRPKAKPAKIPESRGPRPR